MKLLQSFPHGRLKVMILLLLIGGCRGRPILYPSPFADEIRYVCTVLFEPQFSAGQHWSQSVPDRIMVLGERVTVIFFDQKMYTFPPGTQFELPPGNYQCK